MTKEYISRDKFIEQAEARIIFGTPKFNAGLRTAIDVANFIPAADVVEVRHGKWCITDAYPHNVYCSECYETYAQEHWDIWKDGTLPRDYCPSCGAKMDGGQAN